VSSRNNERYPEAFGSLWQNFKMNDRGGRILCQRKGKGGCGKGCNEVMNPRGKKRLTLMAGRKDFGR